MEAPSTGAFASARATFEEVVSFLGSDEAAELDHGPKRPSTPEGGRCCACCSPTTCASGLPSKSA